MELIETYFKEKNGAEYEQIHRFGNHCDCSLRLFEE